MMQPSEFLEFWKILKISGMKADLQGNKQQYHANNDSFGIDGLNCFGLLHCFVGNAVSCFHLTGYYFLLNSILLYSEASGEPEVTCKKGQKRCTCQSHNHRTERKAASAQ